MNGKSVYQKRKEAGLCVACGKVPPAEKRTKCADCLKKMSRYMSDWAKKKKTEGICVMCCKPNGNGSKWCDNCQEKVDATRRAEKLEAFDAYGGPICRCCGETIIEFLAIDHVNNDGAEHRRTINGARIYWWLKKNGYPSGFQVLCQNCNLAKHFYGACPHKKTGEK